MDSSVSAPESGAITLEQLANEALRYRAILQAESGELRHVLHQWLDVATYDELVRLASVVFHEQIKQEP